MGMYNFIFILINLKIFIYPKIIILFIKKKYMEWKLNMGIKRTIRYVGSSLSITIPIDIARILEYDEGDIIEYDIDWDNKSLTIKKTED